MRRTLIFAFVGKVPRDSRNVPRFLAERGDCKADGVAEYNPAMGFNKRKMEDARKTEAGKEAAARRVGWARRSSKTPRACSRHSHLMGGRPAFLFGAVAEHAGAFVGLWVGYKLS